MDSQRSLRYTPNPVFHHNTSLSPLPCNVRTLTELFNKHLTGQSEPNDSATLEATNSDKLQIIPEFTKKLILVGSKCLREWENGCKSRNRDLLILQLLRAISVFSLDGTICLENAEFILPRFKPDKHSEHSKQEEISPLTIAGYLGETVSSGISENDDSYFDDHEATTMYAGDFSSDETSSSTMSSNTSESLDSVHSEIDLPLDAHMFIKVEKITGVILPVLCVAFDDECLIMQLTSTLYQRRVLGSSDPAVGILLSRYSSQGCVFVAWLDPGNVDETLPTVHVSIGFSTGTPGFVDGWFDLGDSNSAICLAAVIQSLEGTLKSLHEVAQGADITVLPWRSDVWSDHGRNPSLDGEIITWLEGVSSSMSRTPNPRITELREEAGRSIFPRLTEGQDSPCPISPAQSQASTQPGASTGLNTSTDLKVFSHSKFTNLGPDNIIDPGAPAWELQRHVYRISCCAYSESEEVGSKMHLARARAINEKVDYHNQMTKCCLQRPQAQQLVADAFETADTHFQAGEKLVDLFSDMIEGYADIPTYVELIKKKMHTIIRLVLASADKCYYTREAPARTVLDNMFEHFFIRKEDFISCSVHLEQTIRMPANRATSYILQHLNEPDIDKNLYSLVSGTSEEFSRLVSNANRNPQNSSVSRSLSTALRASTILASETDQQMRELAKTLEDHSICRKFIEVSIREPLTAKCEQKKFLKVIGFEEHPPLSLPVSPTTDIEQTVTTLRGVELYSNKQPQDVTYSPSQFSAARKAKNNHSALIQEEKRGNDDGFHMEKTQWMGDRILSLSDLVLPLLVTEDKRESHNDNQAMNQCISNCVAAATFLHDVIGIADFPVWGICAKGVLCRVVIVWMSSENKAKNGDPETFVLETGTQSYDMKDPVDAINFAIFLLKLRNEASVELERRFDEVKEEFLKKLSTQDDKLKSCKWTRGHQLQEMRVCTDNFISESAMAVSKTAIEKEQKNAKETEKKATGEAEEATEEATEEAGEVPKRHAKNKKDSKEDKVGKGKGRGMTRR